MILATILITAVVALILNHIVINYVDHVRNMSYDNEGRPEFCRCGSCCIIYINHKDSGLRLGMKCSCCGTPTTVYY